MHLDSAQTYHVVYVWVAIVYVAYAVSLSVRARKARQALQESE
jgi:hypothetical protein